MEQQDVKEILNRVLSGDINAYEAIIEAYRATVFRIVAKRIPQDDLESVAHDVFVRCYRSLANFREKSPFEHWLSRIAVRSCYDYWKAKERLGRMVERPMETEHYEWLDTVTRESATEKFESENDQKHANEILEFALNKLEMDDRTVIELYYIDQWSMKDIAKSLQWSLAKVKIKAMRARKKLRSIINEMMRQKRS